MAALSVTASQVLPGANAVIAHGTAGATITAGQPVYLSATDGFYYPADSNLAAGQLNIKGIALNGASAGQPVDFQTAGTITLGAGAAPTVGVVYVVGAVAAGDIAPTTDVTTGWMVTILGVGGATNTIVLCISNSGQVHA